jgi:hypothetical protein
LADSSERHYTWGVKKSIFYVLFVPKLPASPSGKGNYMIRINSKFNSYNVRGATLEGNLIRDQEGYIRAKFLFYHWEGCM